MKEILLYRHANAEKATRDQDDRERPLHAVGRKQARRQGEMLIERSLLPDYITSSEALRASQTVRETVAAMRYTGKVNYIPALYDADAEVYLALVRMQSEGVRRLMIVGHNPAIDEFATRLAGIEVHLQTGCIAHFRLDSARWSDVESETPSLLIGVIAPDTEPA